MFTSNLLFLLADNSGNFTDLPISKIISFLAPVIALFPLFNLSTLFNDLSKSDIEVFFEHNSSFKQRNSALIKINTFLMLALICFESYSFYDISKSQQLTLISNLLWFLFIIIIFCITLFLLYKLRNTKEFKKTYFIILMFFVFSTILIGTKIIELNFNNLITVLLSYYFISYITSWFIYNYQKTPPRKYNIFKVTNKSEVTFKPLFHHFPVEKTKWIYSQNENIYKSETFYLYDLEKDIYYRLTPIGERLT